MIAVEDRMLQKRRGAHEMLLETNRRFLVAIFENEKFWRFAAEDRNQIRKDIALVVVSSNEIQDPFLAMGSQIDFPFRGRV